MKVRVPSPLYSYTDHRAVVDATGGDLAELFADLDRQFPGLRFRIVDEQDRIRPHIKVFVGEHLAPGLDQPLASKDEIMIVAALSGG